MNSISAVIPGCATVKDTEKFQIVLSVRQPTPPSFKNCKRSGINRKTGKLNSYTEASVKKRMEQLENAIVLSLYSACRTSGGAMDGACLKRLRTALSGLSDDSLKEMPWGGFNSQRVTPDLEGIIITITKI